MKYMCSLPRFKGRCEIETILDRRTGISMATDVWIKSHLMRRRPLLVKGHDFCGIAGFEYFIRRLHLLKAAVVLLLRTGARSTHKG